MHFLHKILVHIPDAVEDREQYESQDLIDAIRRYAESETEPFFGQAYDWRETYTAGRWIDSYPVNVMFADDDLDSFVHELESAMQSQRQEMQFCLKKVKSSVGTDLESIAAGLAERKQEWRAESGFNNLTAFYLYCVAAHLYGEYHCDSYFYNTSECTAFICLDDIEAVKSEPSEWALVIFDYHN